MPRLQKPPIKVPFGPPGVMQNYPTKWRPPGPQGKSLAWVDLPGPIYRDNYEFDAALQIYDFGTSSATVYFNLKDHFAKSSYIMYASDLFNALKKFGSQPSENGAIITGRWTFCKKGTRFGLKSV